MMCAKATRIKFFRNRLSSMLGFDLDVFTQLLKCFAIETFHPPLITLVVRHRLRTIHKIETDDLLSARLKLHQKAVAIRPFGGKEPAPTKFPKIPRFRQSRPGRKAHQPDDDKSDFHSPILQRAPVIV